MLLDTDALLWVVDDDTRLGPEARTAIRRSTRMVVSVASLWEISIKTSLGKLAAVPGLRGALVELGVQRLDITDAHLAGLEDLPHHHRDPVDRMLIAQARTEGLPVLTADRQFSAYAITVVDARR